MGFLIIFTARLHRPDLRRRCHGLIALGLLALLPACGEKERPDRIAPEITVPSSVILKATGDEGVTYSWTATAQDDVDGALEVSCTPASGSVFPLGTTRVDCSAHDKAGNTVSDSFTVTVTSATTTIRQLASGRPCAVLSDGTARCWGNGGSGQLGNGDTNNQNVATPTVVVDETGTPLQGIVSISGSGPVCAVLEDGTARCWGSSQGYGLLGNGQKNDIAYTAVTVMDGHGQHLTGIVSIAPANLHNCVLRTDGTVRCWGYNLYGGLGDNTDVDSLVPVLVVDASGEPLQQVTAITTAFDNTCALRADGTVYCWGGNHRGELGNGEVSVDTTTHTSYADAVLDATTALPLQGVVALSGGCAVLADGTARCWGPNNYGSVGDGTTVDRNQAVAVMALPGVPLSDIASISNGGGGHSCALLNDGTLRCWGHNFYGQLGDGTFASYESPAVLQPVTVLGIANAQAVSVFGYSACAILDEGRQAQCWGANDSGQLATGTVREPFRSNVPLIVSALP